MQPTSIQLSLIQTKADPSIAWARFNYFSAFIMTRMIILHIYNSPARDLLLEKNCITLDISKEEGGGQGLRTPMGSVQYILSAHALGSPTLRVDYILRQ